jgi:Flp pilus assembly protein TadG
VDRLRADTDRDRGAAAVEFALVMPVLLLLVFGIVDAGRLLNMQLALTQAAREGVRVAALGGSAGEATSRAQNALFPVTGATSSLTQACPASPTPTSDAELRVTRTYNYITPIQGILNFMGQPALATPTITGRGRMRCNG